MNNKTDKKGFTLLFASLVVSLILSVGIAIANITLAQLTLSTAGRESQVALYNADTALECALYYEYKVVVNPNLPDPQERAYPYAFFPQTEDEIPARMQCAGLPNEPITGGGQAEITTEQDTVTTKYTFNVESCDIEKPSFAIESIKTRKNAGEDGIPYAHYNVTIRTRGYNTCNPENPRRVERGLYVHNIIESI